MHKTLRDAEVGDWVVSRYNGAVGVIRNLNPMPGNDLYKDFILIEWLGSRNRIISGIAFWNPLVVVCENETELLFYKLKYS